MLNHSNETAAMQLPVLVAANSAFGSQWRSQQYLYTHLAKHRPVYFIDPGVPFSRLWRGAPGGGGGAGRGRGVSADFHRVRGFSCLPGERFLPAIRRLNALLHRRHLQRTVACLGRRLKTPYVVAHYAPEMAPLAGCLGEAATVFGCVDDYVTRAPEGAERAHVAACIEAFARESDLVLTPYPLHRERLFPGCDRVRVLEHGVDTSLFRPDAEPPETPLTQTRPRVVYGGRLGEHVDERILASIVGSGASLLFAGEMAWPAERFRRLCALGEVHALGVVSPAALASLYAAADVGIIPYRCTRDLEGTRVLKFLEYCASGLPVVSTRLDGLAQYEPHIFRTDEPEEFARAVHRMAAAPPEPEPLLALAASNTWDSRAELLHGWLDGICHDGGA